MEHVEEAFRMPPMISTFSLHAMSFIGKYCTEIYVPSRSHDGGDDHVLYDETVIYNISRVTYTVNNYTVNNSHRPQRPSL